MLRTDNRFHALCGSLLLVLPWLLIALLGCRASPVPTASVPVDAPTPTLTATARTSITPSPISTPVEPSPSFTTITIWGPEEFAPGEATAGRQVLQAQYDDFTSDNPNLGLDYVPKARYGEAGLLEFLLTADYAAPDVLPDVAIIDAYQLGPLARAGLAQPLDALISEELRTDLFPFAREACTFDGDLLGVQFEADIEHLIYYTKALEAPPATWADLFAQPISYTFPAAGEGGLVNDAYLIQYLAQGGRFVDEEGRIALESSPVQRVLRLYDAVLKYDVTSPRVLELSSLEDCWQVYAEGNITVSHVSSWRYLTSRAVLQDTEFAPLPTETGRVSTMNRGWAFVIITPDPQRQAAAAQLIEWLTAPPNLAQWSVATNHLPTRSSALQLTGWPEDYVQFLQTQLENAFFRPSIPEFERIAQALQRAVEDVLTRRSTPRQATSQVIDSLQ